MAEPLGWRVCLGCRAANGLHGEFCSVFLYDRRLVRQGKRTMIYVSVGTVLAYVAVLNGLRLTQGHVVRSSPVGLVLFFLIMIVLWPVVGAMALSGDLLSEADWP